MKKDNLKLSEQNKYKKILLTGTFPDKLNGNLSIRNYIVSESQGLTAISVSNYPTDSLYYVREEKFDLVLGVGSILPDTDYVSKLSQIARQLKVPLALWLHDDPYEVDYNYKVENCCDVIFTNDKNSIFSYNRKNVFHLPLAGSVSHHYKEIKDTQKLIDISFCGIGYENRKRIISRLKHVLSTKNTRIYGEQWQPDLNFTNNTKLDTQEYINLAAKSLFTINIGREFNLANERNNIVPSTPGPRTFEVALAGSAQIMFTDSLEILDYFDHKKEILLFSNVDEFECLVNAGIADPAYPLKIALAAQKKALAEHTYKHRLIELLNICNEVLN